MSRSPSFRQLGVLAAVVLLLLLLVLVMEGCGTGGGPADPGSSMPGKPTPSTPATLPSPTPEPTTDVYFLVDTRLGFRLVRERWALPADGAAHEAVQAMIRGPRDPDYRTTWNPATRVLGVRREGQVVIVDLSSDARTANAGSEVAERMVQQLVWTVTGVLGDELSVMLHIDGRPAGELWGVLAWDDPVRRAAAIDVRALVQIDLPAPGARVLPRVVVTGEAAAFEANVPWRILDDAGRVVREGTTMTSEGQRFAPFSFTVDLDPGTYVVEVREDDPSDGAAGTPMTDSRVFTVGPALR